MSLRRWNSVAERACLDRYILISEMLLEEESVDDSSSSDSSMEGMEDTLDQDLSFLTDVEDDEDEQEDTEEDDAMSVNIVNKVLQETIAYSNYINCPLLDTAIDFDAPPLKIDDLDESKCILEFRFRKLELLEIANLLWPKMELFLEGTRDKIVVQNRYTCDYELGCCLSCFAYLAHVEFVQTWKPSSKCESPISLLPLIHILMHSTLWLFPTFQIHQSSSIDSSSILS
jgi:hypothetical protein